MCCIGAGPGSEVLGLHEVLPKDTHWYLMDSCEQWLHSARLLLQNIPGIKFNYGAFDITARFHPAHVFKKVRACICCQNPICIGNSWKIRICHSSQHSSTFKHSLWEFVVEWR